MSVKIGSARIDENGKAKGGRAGDQSGKEVSTQSWYRHSKGWRVFRAKSAEVAERIARNMQCACDNRHIGYDQGQRLTLYEVSKPLGFDCRGVTTDCETDCSALVRVCCAYAGIMLPSFRTTTEPKVLLDSGAFVELEGSQYTDQDKHLGRGDILCTKSQGHTVVVLSNGSRYEGGAPGEALRVEIVNGNCYVRETPDTGGRILGVAHRGETHPYGGQTSPNGWNRVAWRDGQGWVSGKYSRVTA